MNWFLLALRNTFNFRDRARRREYGWFLLGQFIITLCLEFLSTAGGMLGLEILSLVFALVGIVVGIWFAIASVSITTRRLHDLGYSGWWQLFPLAVLIVLIVLALAAGDSVIPLFILAALGYFAYGLWLIFKDGQRFENKYGADPKGKTVQNTVVEENQDKIVQKF